MHTGTGKRYGAQSERGQIEAWGGIVSARLAGYADALGTTPEAVLGAVETAGAEPILDTAEPKGHGKDRDRPTEPELRCLAFSREDFRRLVEAVETGTEEPQEVPA